MVLPKVELKALTQLFHTADPAVVTNGSKGTGIIFSS